MQEFITKSKESLDQRVTTIDDISNQQIKLAEIIKVMNSEMKQKYETISTLLGGV